MDIHSTFGGRARETTISFGSPVPTVAGRGAAPGRSRATTVALFRHQQHRRSVQWLFRTGCSVASNRQMSATSRDGFAGAFRTTQWTRVAEARGYYLEAMGALSILCTRHDE